jgi:hypothetical protein
LLIVTKVRQSQPFSNSVRIVFSLVVVVVCGIFPFVLREIDGDIPFVSESSIRTN